MLFLLATCPIADNTSRLNVKKPLSTALTFGSADTIKIALTAKDNGKARRPHQAFIVLKDVDSGLEVPFPLTTKETGKAVVSIVRNSNPPYHTSPRLTRHSPRKRSPCSSS